MRLPTATNTALLAGLRDADNCSIWEAYVDRYRPLIVRYLSRVGLAPTDAEDVAQDALLSFVTAYRAGGYDRARGRLRDWLFGVVRNALQRWRRRAGRRREVQAAGVSEASDPLACLPADAALEEIWEVEWRRSVVAKCLEIARHEFEAGTIRAFELFACDGLPAAEVAERLGTTRNAVFIAKHRVLQRLRELQRAIEDI